MGNKAMKIEMSNIKDIVAAKERICLRESPSLGLIIDLTFDARMMLKIVMEYKDTREPTVDTTPRAVQSLLVVHSNCVVQVLLLKNCSPIDSIRRKSP